MTHLFTSDAIVSLLTLTILEIVLGIDNVIFVSIIMGRMDPKDFKRARFLWMVFGIIVRVSLLFCLGWLIAHGSKPLFSIFNHPLSLKDLIMLAGGLFLIIKTVGEIHTKLEGEEHELNGTKKVGGNFAKLMGNIVLVDMVFSFDSIITAVGIAQHIEIMATAVVIAMIGMFLFSGKIAAFIEKHPTIKMLALSFLVMVGLVLIMEGWNPEKAHDLKLKNYLYFGMAFSFLVELLNMRVRKKSSTPVTLHEPNMDKSMDKENDVL
jgi:predicted tellurium resistance membrane protein TerC